mmetsp:Transcript_37519/g.87494  ORF Transcript_37519/g.87494 Transcript_37519/m.87494 type:complete len:117 (+) Transcript_37519:758-1108(+)
MSWHQDDILYFPKPQIEVVFTLENSSDCSTMWKEYDNGDKGNIRFNSVETTPNSAIFIRAGSVEHCVSTLKRGKRVILKIVFVHNNSTMDKKSVEVLNQFGKKHKAIKKSGKMKKR